MGPPLSRQVGAFAKLAERLRRCLPSTWSALTQQCGPATRPSPAVRSHIFKSELTAYGIRLLCSGALLLRLLDSYAVRFSEMLDGRSEHLPTSELAGGARIRHIFQDIFVRGLSDLNPSR